MTVVTQLYKMRQRIHNSMNSGGRWELLGSSAEGDKAKNLEDYKDKEKEYREIKTNNQTHNHPIFYVGKVNDKLETQRKERNMPMINPKEFYREKCKGKCWLREVQGKEALGICVEEMSK